MRWRSSLCSGLRQSSHVLPPSIILSSLGLRGPQALVRQQARISRRAHSSSTSPRPVTIGIRREDPARLWERRVPLTPQAVATLVRDSNVEVVVQSCDRRVFKDSEYEAVSFPVSFAIVFILDSASRYLHTRDSPIYDRDRHLLLEAEYHRSRLY